MKTDHAHVEASLLAGVLLAVIGLVDLIVPLADGHPLKLPVYLLLFGVIYGISYILIRRTWR